MEGVTNKGLITKPIPCQPNTIEAIFACLEVLVMNMAMNMVAQMESNVLVLGKTSSIITCANKSNPMKAWTSTIVLMALRTTLNSTFGTKILATWWGWPKQCMKHHFFPPKCLLLWYLIINCFVRWLHYMKMGEHQGCWLNQIKIQFQQWFSIIF